MMSRTIEFVLYCINNATVLQHGLRYILTPASKYREVYVLCFFLHVYFNVFHNFITSSSLARVSFSSWL